MTRVEDEGAADDSALDARSFYRSRYARNQEGMSLRLRQVYLLARRYPSECILDIGCGDGAFALRLREACSAERACGVDISAAAAELARGRGIEATAIDVGSEALPYPDATFDLVFAGEIIEHLFDTDHFLREVRRILRPTGVFILTTPNLASWYNRIALTLGFQPFWTEVSLSKNPGKLIRAAATPSGHIRVMTTRALRGLLTESGFRVLQTFGSPQPEFLPKSLRLAELLFARIPEFSGNVGVVAAPI